MKNLLNFIIFLSITICFAESYDIKSQHITATFNDLSTENIEYNNGKYYLSEGAEHGSICTFITKSPYEYFTGFAMTLNGNCPEEFSIIIDFYWSYDSINWQAPIRDDEVGHNPPGFGIQGDAIFSDFMFPDNPPAPYYKAVIHFFKINGQSPSVYNAEFVFINAGKTREQPIPVARELESLSETSCPMPSYVSRSGWGCGEADSPSWWPSYTNAWIWAIHHTAGATSTPSDPPAVVRSIWYYHTYTNGWGDIGYQFLLDQNGIIYQGRYNSDLANRDAVGAHVGGHNTGCVGLSVMGNFESAYVHDATLTSIYDLVSWKCEQRDIDPYGSSWLVDGTYSNISGHRDIGSTACPGANFYALMPSVRDSVAARLAGTGPVIPDGDSIIVDNGDPEYSTTGSWINGTYNPSSGWESDYQYCNAGGTTETARFCPYLPVHGYYNVYMWWYAGSNRCNNVTVDIHGVEDHSVTISQQGSGAEWHLLGNFEFNDWNYGYVEISDETYSDGSVVIADAVLWVLSEELAIDETIQSNDLINIYPNPFNSSCNIYAPSDAIIEIYNNHGDLVHSEFCSKGSVQWSPIGIPSGVYLVKIIQDNGVVWKRISYIK